MENCLIVSKLQYKDLIDAFQNILSNNNLLTYNFDEAANIRRLHWRLLEINKLINKIKI
jgi:hypothetical protein